MLLQETESRKKDDAPAAYDDSGREQSNLSANAGPIYPAHKCLPMKEIVIDPDEVQANPDQWRNIGEEVSEQLDYSPAQCLKQRLIRRKFVKLDAPFTAPVIAPLPPCLQERCLATPDLIAQSGQQIRRPHAALPPRVNQQESLRRRDSPPEPLSLIWNWPHSDLSGDYSLAKHGRLFAD